MPFSPSLRALACSASLLILQACGGGGGGGDTTTGTAPAAPPPSQTTQPQADPMATVAVNDPGSTLPAHWQTGVFAQIFVRSYQDSDGDGQGDLKGLRSRLPYLKSLGVSGLWLMPVTNSQDHDHGYAVTDYRGIERDYGSLADFDALVAEAHRLGIGIVMDYVMNHSAADHPLFQSSKASRTSPYRDWYVWKDSLPGGWNIYGKNPWYTLATTTGAYFAGFWDQMPDWNLRTPAVVAYHHDSLRFWLNRGVDGFRFDATANLVENGPQAWEAQPENLPLMRDVRTVLDAYHQRFMVCEAPPAVDANNAACGSAFAFGHPQQVIAAARGEAWAVQASASYFPTGQASTKSTLLSNHDTFAGPRPWDQLAGNVAQYKLAAATYLLQPGTPFIYYGEEIGMSRGNLDGDVQLRVPMSWTGDAARAGFTTGTPFRARSANVATNNVAAQENDPNSLLNHYRAMISLRHALPSIARGTYDNPTVNGLVYTFQRTLGDERTVIAINYGTIAATASVSGLPATAVLEREFPSGSADAAADAYGNATFTLPAQSVSVFVVGN